MDGGGGSTGKGVHCHMFATQVHLSSILSEKKRFASDAKSTAASNQTQDGFWCWDGIEIPELSKQKNSTAQREESESENSDKEKVRQNKTRAGQQNRTKMTSILIC